MAIAVEEATVEMALCKMHGSLLWRSLLISGVIWGLPTLAIAQPVADDTLGSERTIVSPDVVIRGIPSNQIDGGARRGANLFHSFQAFNIDAGRGAYFSNPDGVATILARVTGGARSNIFGTLGVLGNANLFLLNPSGILFGPNAQLDLRGSFLASTADSFVFDNGFAFRATNPQVPPLLTMNVPIGLQYGGSPGATQVQGASLQVPDGQTLILAGGAVNVDGAALLAFGGRVELVGVGGTGEVGLTQQGQEWRLGVPEGLARADVTIGNDAFVDVSSDGGGSIAITARNFTGTGARTGLLAGIATDLGTVGAQAGDIDINTTGAINLNESTVENIVIGAGNAGDINITTVSLSLSNGSYVETATYSQGDAGNVNITASNAVFFDGVGTFPSGAYSQVYSEAIGQGGDINITSGALSLTNGAQVSASVLGQGDAGSITVMLEDLVSFDGAGSGVYSQVLENGIGNASNINIITDFLTLTNGAQIGASTFGQGDAGNISITARDRVFIDGTLSTGFASAVLSRVELGAIGQGGDITITTGLLSLTKGAQVGAGIEGRGNAGDIIITARDKVSFDGLGSDIYTGVLSTVSPEGVGRGGDIIITTGSLTSVNGSGISVGVAGRGDAGNINIMARDRVSFDGLGSGGLSGTDSTIFAGGIGRGGTTRITTNSLSITNGAVVAAGTQGQGDSGDIIITARDAVFATGETRFGSTSFNSGVFGAVSPRAVGRGGDINISTGSLTFTDGARLDARTFGEGAAGDITITARDAIFFDGVDKEGFPGGAFSSVSSDAIGQGGDIRITADSLSITNGAVVSAATFGQGRAGNIIITASDRVSFDGAVGSPGSASGAFSTVLLGAIGRGGNIRINADSLSITNGAQVNAATSGQGRAGDIIFNTPTLFVAGDAQVLAETTSVGNGGSILVNAPTSVNLRRADDLSPVLSVETSGAGRAGDITINTPRLTLAERARITATATETATNRQGGGSITLNASNLNLAGTVGVFAETQGQSPAGTLRLNPYRNQPDLDISLMPNSRISASTRGGGRGGNLIVTAPRSIGITGSGRLAVATRSSGNAGSMRFTTGQLSLNDGVKISASTSGSGEAGAISINADEFTLGGGARVATNTSSQGEAGNITVQTSDRLFLTGRRTGLFASTAPDSSGDGGNIAIDPELVQLEDGATIAVDSQGSGTGGDITLQADRLVLNQSFITAETNSAQGGNIMLQVPELLLLRDRSRISTTAGTAQAGGDGGNVTVNGQFIVAVPDENNDISANAFTGRGGNVSINAESILGTEFRSQPTPLSDITASSRFGAPGVVLINTPDVDPGQGLVQLPTDVTDASRLIAQTCPTRDATDTQTNEFIITGRGGLPSSVNEAVNPDAVQVELVTTTPEEDSAVTPVNLEQVSPLASSASPIAEAEGWQMAADGRVMLVAATDLNVVAPTPNRPTHCH